MPFKETLTNLDISKLLDKVQETAEKSVIEMFVEVGEKCLEAMESERGYTNVSGNMSDSRGFVVVRNRLVIHESEFKSTKGGQTGRSLAHQRALNIGGIGLVIVAGMDYAEELEASGKNVYSSGYLKAENLIPKMLNQLGFK